jgi:hypothetical protein
MKYDTTLLHYGAPLVRSGSHLHVQGLWGVGRLESILWNRFGRNLRKKPNLVRFKFAIMTT